MAAKNLRCCSVGNCGQPYWANGLCRFHEQRRCKGTPLDAPYQPRSANKRGWIHNGYKWVMTPDGREVMEHRHLMEKHLGRKLHTDETVHHINGIKTDNSLDNLEVVDRAEHTSRHRVHNPPCRICGKDGKGTRGLCGKHYGREKYLVSKQVDTIWYGMRLWDKRNR
jgi:hypothetical protein